MSAWLRAAPEGGGTGSGWWPPAAAGPGASAQCSSEHGGRPEAAWTRRGRGSQGAASWSEAALRRPAGAAESRGRWQEVPQVRGLPPKLTLAPCQTPGPAGAAGRGAERGPHWAAPPGVAWCRPLACGARVSSPVGWDCHQCSVGPRPGAGVPSSGGCRPCPPSLGPTCRACAVRRSMRAARAWPAGCTGRPGRLAPSGTRRVSRAGGAAGVGGAPRSRRARPPRLAPAAPQRAGTAHGLGPETPSRARGLFPTSDSAHGPVAWPWGGKQAVGGSFAPPKGPHPYLLCPGGQGLVPRVGVGGEP